MKKILVILNGIDYPASLISYSIQLAKLDHSFLHFSVKSSLPNAGSFAYPFPSDLTIAEKENKLLELTSFSDQQLIEANLQMIRDEVEAASLQYKMDPEMDHTTEELIDQSAFSDLIIVDRNEVSNDSSIQQLLVDTHCPVIIAPVNDQLTDQVILCYDESFSSIYSIKMFNYLFPEWKDLSTELISINPKGDNGTKLDSYISDWLPQHFTNLNRIILEGNLQKELLSHINKEGRRSFVVMGSYGRNAIARLFHKSLANVIISESDATLFVVHE